MNRKTAFINFPWKYLLNIIYNVDNNGFVNCKQFTTKGFSQLKALCNSQYFASSSQWYESVWFVVILIYNVEIL